MIFEMQKPQNMVMIEIDKHSHVRLADFLLLFRCLFEVLRDWRELTSVSLNPKLPTKSAGQDSQRSALWQRTTKHITGSQRLVFPQNLRLSSGSSCVKPVCTKVRRGSVSCAACKYGLIPVQWSWWDRCYSCILPPRWSTYWWFTDCLHCLHSSVLRLFPIGSIRQHGPVGLHSRAPPACGAHAPYPLLVSWLHTSK